MRAAVQAHAAVAASPAQPTIARRAAAPSKKKATGPASFKDEGWAEFEEYGSFAGPPGRPIVLDVGATSLLLTWDAPHHLGGTGFEVLGYQVRVQCGGSGGFRVGLRGRLGGRGGAEG